MVEVYHVEDDNMTTAFTPKKGKIRASMVPAIALIHDVPVDADHVAALAKNIKHNGQLSPVLVLKGTHDIIDGFHRVSAMQKLGMDVQIIEKTLTNEEFVAARIVAATQHEGIKIDRAVLWVSAEWDTQTFASQHKGVAAAFNAVTKGKASNEVVDWVTKQSERWGAAVSYMRSHWLYHYEKSQLCDSESKTPTIPENPAVVSNNGAVPPRVKNVHASGKMFVADANKLNDDLLKTLPKMVLSDLAVTLLQVQTICGTQLEYLFSLPTEEK